MMKRGVVREAVLRRADAFPNAAEKQNGEKEKEKDRQKKKGRRVWRSPERILVYLLKAKTN